MFLKNTFTIFNTNISLLFKTLFYIFILFVIFASVVAAITTPLLDAISGFAVWGDVIAESINGWLAGDYSIGSSISNIFEDLFTGISSEVSSYLWMLFLIVFLFKFFIGLIKLPIAYVLYNSMAQNFEISFKNAIITHFGRSIVFSLWHSVITIVLDMLIFTFAGFIISITNGFMGLFSYSLGIFVALLLYGLRTGLFSQWLPLVVAEKMSVSKAFFKSFKVSFVHFHRATQSYCALIFAIFTVIVTTAIPTLLIAPIIALPAYIILSTIIDLVANFAANKTKFYINKNTIIEE
ncbi:MAG: hypothetical protein R3Y23_03285 [Bacillota bacterium]